MGVIFTCQHRRIDYRIIGTGTSELNNCSFVDEIKDFITYKCHPCKIKFANQRGLGGDIWLDVNDVTKDGEWKDDCGQLQTYLPFHSQQPNGGNNQFWAHVHSDGTWGDRGEEIDYFNTLCTHILSGTAP